MDGFESPRRDGCCKMQSVYGSNKCFSDVVSFHQSRSLLTADSSMMTMTMTIPEGQVDMQPIGRTKVQVQAFLALVSGMLPPLYDSRSVSTDLFM